MSTAYFTLDSFVFELLPKGSLDFEMTRSIGKLDFPGAPPVYQDMGFDEKTLDFSGSIVKENAWKVSEMIESMHWGGKEYVLRYGDIEKTVRIQKYSPKFIRSDRVDYSIHLIVCFPAELVQIDQVAVTSPLLLSPKLADTMDRTYTVKAGDTLWSIAARSDVYGDGTKWELIAKANSITDEYSLQVGQVIKIPSPGNVKSSIQADIINSAVSPAQKSELTLLLAGGEVGLVESP